MKNDGEFENRSEISRKLQIFDFFRAMNPSLAGHVFPASSASTSGAPGAHSATTSGGAGLIGISAATQAQLQAQQAAQAAAAAAAAAAAQATQSLYINTSVAPGAQAASAQGGGGGQVVAAQQSNQAATAEAIRLLQGLPPFLTAGSGSAGIPYFSALSQQLNQLGAAAPGAPGTLNGLQFPANAALGPQLAGAALLAAVPGAQQQIKVVFLKAKIEVFWNFQQ